MQKPNPTVSFLYRNSPLAIRKRNLACTARAVQTGQMWCPPEQRGSSWVVGLGIPSLPEGLQKGRAPPAVKFSSFSNTVRVWYKTVLHACAYADFAA